MMHTDLPVFVLSAAGLLALVGVGEALRVFGHVAPEVSRKVVHAGVALFVAATPWLFTKPDLIYVLAAVFVGVNAVALRKGWFRGIHGTERASWGTVTMPLVLLPALWVGWTMEPGRVWALQIAFLVLAIADPLATLVGTRMKHPRRYAIGGHVKSIAGSVVFFVVALLLSGGALAWLFERGVIDWLGWQVGAAALVVALVATAVEALGSHGWDNFFIVLAVLLLLVYFDAHPDARSSVVFATGVGVGFAVLAQQFRLLELSGAVAGGLLAVSLLSVSGWAWAVPGFAFFVTSSALSKLESRHKAKAEALSEKGSQRDAGQVYANGGVAWALLLLFMLYPADLLYLGFLGAFAAATADTWATEVGTYFRAAPRLVTTGRKVPPGTSGAVSGPGTLAALLGALTIALCARRYAEMPFGMTEVLVVTGSGFLASFVDSLLGATVQARFRDAATGKETERGSGMAGAFTLIRGRRWLRNDQVNGLCTLAGAALAVAGRLLL